MDDIAIGPDKDPSAKATDPEARSTIEGVDAEKTSEWEDVEGLPGQEAKPFSKPTPPDGKLGAPAPGDANPHTGRVDHGLVTDRRNPGRSD